MAADDETHRKLKEALEKKNAKLRSGNPTGNGPVKTNGSTRGSASHQQQFRRKSG